MAGRGGGVIFKAFSEMRYEHFAEYLIEFFGYPNTLSGLHIHRVRVEGVRKYIVFDDEARDALGEDHWLLQEACNGKD